MEKVGKFFRSRKRHVQKEQQNASPSLSSSEPQAVLPLGSGSFTPDGSVIFAPSSAMMKVIFTPSSAMMKQVESKQTLGTFSEVSTSEDDSVRATTIRPDNPPSSRFIREKASFLRVADLGMATRYGRSATEESSSDEPNLDHPADTPPPGVDYDPKEMWVALNDGNGSHAPIAPLAVASFADFALKTCMDDGMFSPDSRTEKLIANGKNQSAWMKTTFQPGQVELPSGSRPEEKDVLIWTGYFKHGLYGHDFPVVRAAGVINRSAKALMTLMVDSTRVREYNKMSLKREDVTTFQDDINKNGPFGQSLTKVIKSQNKPPLVRSVIEFVSILHAKELPDKSGYLLVARAVHTPEDEGAPSHIVRSEILMGVNVIRAIKGFEDSHCLMINVNQIRSSLMAMLPQMLAKRVGLAAAVDFIKNIRAVR